MDGTQQMSRSYSPVCPACATLEPVEMVKCTHGEPITPKDKAKWDEWSKAYEAEEQENLGVITPANDNGQCEVFLEK